MIYAVIDTNVLVSALITHNSEAATAKVVYEVSLSHEDSFLVTGNLKHYPTSPRVITPAAFVDLIK